jgi:predicted transcriptional regulator
MEERRDKEHIIEVTADKEQQEQAILRISEATGIETERIEKSIAKLERNGILTEERSIFVDTRGCIQERIQDYCCHEKLEYEEYYCTTYIEQEILEEKRQNKLRRFHASRKPLPRTAPKAKSWSWNRIRSRPNTKHGYH